MPEQCLSVPDPFEVERPKSITVKYYNSEGEPIQKDFTGIRSRVFQHELDHLNGITIDMKGKK